MKDLLYNVLFWAYKVARTLGHTWSDLDWSDVWAAVEAVDNPANLLSVEWAIREKCRTELEPGPAGWGFDAPGLYATDGGTVGYRHQTRGGRMAIEVWANQAHTMAHIVVNRPAPLPPAAQIWLDLGGEAPVIVASEFGPWAERHRISMLDALEAFGIDGNWLPPSIPDKELLERDHEFLRQYHGVSA